MTAYREGFSAYRRALGVVILFTLAVNALILTVPLYMMSIYDRVLGSRHIDTLIMLSVLALGALLVFGILDAVRQMILNRTALSIDAKLGGPVLARHIYETRSGTGAADVEGLRDISTLRGFLTSPVLIAFLDGPVAPLYLIIVFVIHPLLGTIALVGSLILVGIGIANQIITAKPYRDSGGHMAQSFGHALSYMRSAEAIRAMGMVESCVARWGHSTSDSLSALDQATRRNSALTAASKAIRLLLQVGVLGFGAYLVLQQQITPGVIIAASILSARALAPVEQAIGGWKMAVQAWGAHRRLRDRFRDMPRTGEEMRMPDPAGYVLFDRVYYQAKQGQDPILQNMTLQLEPGEIVGVVGTSGAGKTTFARLIAGIVHATRGEVRIDGTDIQQLDPERLGSFIGYVPQDVELLPGTIRENIARMEAEPDDEEVLKAAQMANVHALIQHLPDGYNTRVGPGGIALSGGQRQRVLLARAFYKKPRILVLDEPNANLDAEGEKALVEAVQNAKGWGALVIFITQRSGILPHVDKILVIRAGQMDAYGPRDEVMARLVGGQQQQRRAAADGDGRMVSLRGQISGNFAGSGE